ncbi:hypothetical protein [Polaromonas jejuensis]|uniref:Uncharacterized protein n=1 Tax=Polaromonas jejuensis TaxID=457502 RepID=A0ABW0QDQ2_9BURK|nr:hypothetical protein [Polaromonas jejuensis]
MHRGDEQALGCSLIALTSDICASLKKAVPESKKPCKSQILRGFSFDHRTEHVDGLKEMPADVLRNAFSGQGEPLLSTNWWSIFDLGRRLRSEFCQSNHVPYSRF